MPEREIWGPNDLVELILDDDRSHQFERLPDPPVEEGSAYFDPEATAIAALAVVGNIHATIEVARLVARGIRKWFRKPRDDEREPTNLTIGVMRDGELHRLEIERSMTDEEIANTVEAFLGD